MSHAQKATCTFTVSSWSEEVYADIDGEGTTAGELYFPKRGLSRAAVGYTYSGEVEGSSTLVYLMGYRDGDDLVIGLERFEGSIGGQEGSCVLRHEAVHDATGVRGTATVVPGMGTGGLERLSGEAALEIAGHSETGYPLVLCYDLG